jgi:V/A-type H+-transporting ATPase subunit I
MERLGLEYEPRQATGPVLPESDLGGLEKRLGELERTLPVLQDRLASLSEEQQRKTWQKSLLRSLVDADPALDVLRRSPRLAVRVGAVTAANLSILQERLSGFPHLLELLGEFGPGQAFVAAATSTEREKVDTALRQSSCEVAALPDRSARELLSEVDREAAEVAADFQSADGAFRAATAEARRSLCVLRHASEVALALLKARRHFGHTARLSLISGWVPRDKLAEVRERVLDVTGGSAYLESEDPREIREVRDGTLRVPILLANPLLLRPFEKLVTTYGAPEYSEVEPTAFLAITFLLMFGVMFGDVGQGGLLAAAGYLVADHALRIGKGLRSTHLHNPPVLDGQLKTAGVGAVQGTNAGAINGAHCRGFHTNRGVGVVRCICRKYRQLLGREQISCQEWPKPDCRGKRALACNCWGPDREGSWAVPAT